MTSRRESEDNGQHNDALDKAIDMLLYHHGREAVRESVMRRSMSTDGESSQYSKPAVEELQQQIIDLLSSENEVKLPTKYSVAKSASKAFPSGSQSAAEDGIERYLRGGSGRYKGRMGTMLLVALEIEGSSGPYSHARFRACLEKYLELEPAETDAQLARVYIDRIHELRAAYERHIGLPPSDELSMREIREALPPRFTFRLENE